MRQEYTLAELAAAVGMTERNVRAYRSRGLIRPPRLRGRVGYYDLGHLSQLRLVQALTGRGLSLQVVGQLMEKNLAEHELARLIREDLPEGPPLPLSPVVIEELTRDDPTLFDAMVEHGIARSGESGPEADPALLALAMQLAGYGLSAVDVAGVLLAGARAAAAAEEHLRRSLGGAVDEAASDPTGDPTPEAAPSDAPENVAETVAETQPDPARARRRAESRRTDATATMVALELAAMAFRISLDSRLSPRGR